MRVTVRELAGVLGGTVLGDPERVISGISSLHEATPNDVSFLANPKYAPFLSETRAGAVLVASPQAEASGRNGDLVQIVVANPDYAFAKVVGTYGPKSMPPPPGIHPTAVIGESVKLGANVAIGAYVVIAEGASIGANTVIYPQVYIGAHSAIGDDCLIYPQVTIRERLTLGNRVILHPGAVIGSDGFGYASVAGVHHKIPQVGTVVIEDDVEIGSNTTIDRARVGCTRIGVGTKIDNLVQIAHNVEIGGHCRIVAQVGIAGSTRIGKHVVLAGQCGIVGHITIGDQAVVTAMSGVSKDIPAKAVVRGAPAYDFKTAQAMEIAVRRLPGTQTKVKELSAKVEELEKTLAQLVKRLGGATGEGGPGGEGRSASS
jgi:UDP-3-O-[3-hydroxymyristoyl] glucosamine N-acyltransferase